MYYENGKAKDVKIAYIGGGSRAWAWILMNDLAKAKKMSGTVYLYDIEKEAAENNEKIGNSFPGEDWSYKAVPALKDALEGANFVIISILPGTFDEMESDVHAPEKYGIYQSVGDTAGPGGFIRALRTVPMMREIAANVREYCPDAFVLNFTNPMAISVGALYREFPEIRAYGCCHEVFGTQALLSHALADIEGIEGVRRQEITTTVVGVNHFTWITKANYHNMDLFKVYDKFVEKYWETGYNKGGLGNWMNNSFSSDARVRLDLYKNYGYIAAAGDRHLAEFMDFETYLKDCKTWTFGLTPVSWRKNDLKNRLAKSARLLSGEDTWKLHDTGEEAVEQMEALLGLGDFITNVNLPNRGQIPNLPMGTVVETNAAFRDGILEPVIAGNLPDSIYPLISRAASENDMAINAAFSLDLSYAKKCFRKLNLIKALTDDEKDELFDTMIENTKTYLKDYKN